MSGVKRVLAVAAVGVLALAGVFLGKWYYTTAMEPIDPNRGVYGMDGLEIWIDLNAHMPDFARIWACDTLLAREAEALGGKPAAIRNPHSCQADFGKVPVGQPYDQTVDANLRQATDGLDATKAEAVRSCFASRIATVLTAEDIASFNADVAGPASSKVVIGVNTAARECRTEIGA